MVTSNSMPLQSSPIGLILAGGQSRRFGQDKALYCLPGEQQPLCAKMATLLQPFCSTILIGANAQNQHRLQVYFQAEPHVHVLTDQPPYQGCGPLSALFAASHWLAQATPELLMVPTDYPYLTSAELKTVWTNWPSFLATPQWSHFTIAHFQLPVDQLTTALADQHYRLQTFLKQACQCQPQLIAPTDHLQNLNYRR